MKAIWISAVLPLALGQPLLAKSEVELLRERCAAHEQRIQQLEQENQRLRGVEQTKAERPTATTPASKEERNYVVRKGDTLERISRKTGVNIATLGELNGLKASTVIHPGLRLKLPATPAKPMTESAATKVSEPQPKQAPATISKAEAPVAAKTISNPIATTPANATPKAKTEAKGDPKNAAKTDAKSIPPSPVDESKSVIRSITIQSPVVYSDFASKQGTTTERLNQLNGLSLGNSTLLAVGSELYVPAQP